MSLASFYTPSMFHQAYMLVCVVILKSASLFHGLPGLLDGMILLFGFIYLLSHVLFYDLQLLESDCSSPRNSNVSDGDVLRLSPWLNHEEGSKAAEANSPARRSRRVGRQPLKYLSAESEEEVRRWQKHIAF